MGLWSSTRTDGKYVERWLPELEKRGWPAVRAALALHVGKRPSVREVVVGLAAAELVGAAGGGWSDPELPPKAAQWLAKNRAGLPPALKPMAAACVRRALDSFADVWAEGDEDFGYQSAAVELLSALGAPPDGGAEDSPER